MITAGTDNHPADIERSFAFRCFQESGVIFVNESTSDVTADASKYVELQSVIVI